jgi:hypothetical protein
MHAALFDLPHVINLIEIGHLNIHDYNVIFDGMVI